MRIKHLSSLLTPPYSFAAVSLFTSCFVVLLDNQLFWQNLLTRLGGVGHWQFVLSLAAILVLLIHLVFSLMVFRPIFKPVLVMVLLSAAMVSYFSDAYGVVIDKSMIHNILETDVHEAWELVTWPLFGHLLLYGVFPALLVALIPVRNIGWRRGWLLSARNVALSFAILATLFMADYKSFILFGRAHRDLQVYLNPWYPLSSLHNVVKTRYFAKASQPLQVVAADAVRDKRAKPSVVVLVVGETARSSELAANGYPRNTTPYTASRDVIDFADVESCGTATAESLPCMFSLLDRSNYRRSKAARYENLLDILQRTGVKVVWRDNDSGSKGVADRVAYEDFSRRDDSHWCSGDNCYDEILLEGLADLISNNQGDLLVVLHIKGSHGPSYYKRSPAEFKVFVPECTQDNVQDCPQQSIVNAYDNTIVYTDYVLAKVVDLLRAKNVATAMLYVSDHGESLGENGIYLHGLPYALAPSEQTHVPMMFWASDEFYVQHHLEKNAIIARRGKNYSHDYLFHSLLGLFNVQTRVYRPSLDLFTSAQPMTAMNLPGR